MPAPSAPWGTARDARRALHDASRRAASRRDALAEQEYQIQHLVARLVDRLVTYTNRDVAWFVKGGIRTAVVAMPVRFSGELDVQFDQRTLEEAVDDLCRAAREDLGDFLAYDYVGRQAYDNHPTACRVTFQVRMGTTPLQEISVDVATQARLTDNVVHKRGLDPLGFGGLPRPATWPLYPTVDQIADKVAATFELTPARGGSPRPSNRFRDIVDLEIIAGSESCDGTKLMQAITAEFQARKLNLPTTFNVPDERIWDAEYRTIVNAIGELRNRTLADSLAVVRALVDPALNLTLGGQTWDPQTHSWR